MDFGQVGTFMVLVGGYSNSTPIPTTRRPSLLYNLWEILAYISNDPSITGIFLMIDTLDECNIGLNELLKLIIDKNSSRPSKVKWLMTSRNEPVLNGGLSACLMPTILSQGVESRLLSQ
jgi:hypothetical protein